MHWLAGMLITSPNLDLRFSSQGWKERESTSEFAPCVFSWRFPVPSILDSKNASPKRSSPDSVLTILFSTCGAIAVHYRYSKLLRSRKTSLPVLILFFLFFRIILPILIWAITTIKAIELDPNDKWCKLHWMSDFQWVNFHFPCNHDEQQSNVTPDYSPNLASTPPSRPVIYTFDLIRFHSKRDHPTLREPWDWSKLIS